MKMKIVKVTDKGQISLPITFQRSAGIKKGDSLLVVQERDSIILQKVREDRFKDLLKHSEKIASKLWDNKHDKVWDNV